MPTEKDQKPATKKLRVAFLTPEYDRFAKHSGLGAYVGRIADAFASSGHYVRVLTTGNEAYEFVQENGVQVEVVPRNPLKVLQLFGSIARRILDPSQLQNVIARIETAYSLAKALRRNESSDGQFDIVQSSSYSFTGLFVRRRKDRCHLVRIGSDRSVWHEADDKAVELPLRLESLLERINIRRANIAYAPSKWLADHCQLKCRRTVVVVRPPMPNAHFNEHASSTETDSHHERFLIHFGVIGSRKGSDFVIQALKLAVQKEPGIRMIWAGWEKKDGEIERILQSLGSNRHNVCFVGKLDREELLSLVARADASVLPSRVDNLPNTAIESLRCGTPVITFQRNGVDELIDVGRNGDAVAFGDSNALAKLMVEVWQHNVPWIGLGFQRPTIFAEMKPSVCVQNLIRLYSQQGLAHKPGQVCA